MIRSTQHHLKDLNAGKLESYKNFLDEYSRYCNFIINKIWISGYKDFNVRDNSLELPKYIDYKDFDVNTRLSARAKSSAVTQVSGIIRGVVEKQKRRNYINKLKNKNYKVKFTKPKPNYIPAQLSSKCAKWIQTDGKFEGFIKLSSLGDFPKIHIPITKHPKTGGRLKGGFLFSKNFIQCVWEKEPLEYNTGENGVVAIDQGFKDVATLSNGVTTPKECRHGHSLEKICKKMAYKKKGSKSFKKAQTHRKNFVNWSINQLNFSNFSEVRLEKIVNIRKGKKTNRIMSHWSNPEIRDKIKRKCEELDVPVVEQSCAYRSQRCSNCGQVRKANRQKKLYCCKNCGTEMDADFNASLNHIVDLPDVPHSFLGKKLNLGNGFFWKPDGFFIDEERRVPCSPNQ